MQVNSTGSPEINAVLAQMRALRAQGGAATPALDPSQAAAMDRAASSSAIGAAQQTNAPSFGTALRGAIDAVNDLQQTASASSTAFASGQTNDLVKVMIDSQKASVGFQAMVQARNRMVTAYQDIMNMPI